MKKETVFQRYEFKYLLTRGQQARLLSAAGARLRPDEYSHSSIRNLYLDTPDFRLIRRSLEKPVYKEKLRLRSYGVPREMDNVFLEVKKKVRGVVYKRRICLPLAQAMECLAQGSVPAAGGQIGREIAYMLRRYRLRPAVLLAYDRTAYAELEPSPNRLRITIDRDIRSRQTDLDLRLGAAGELLLAPGMRLMEIKTAHAIPLWLCAVLDQNEIRPTSFSKYGRVYEAHMRAGQARAMRPAFVKGGVADAFCHV